MIVLSTNSEYSDCFATFLQEYNPSLFPGPSGRGGGIVAND